MSIASSILLFSNSIPISLLKSLSSMGLVMTIEINIARTSRGKALDTSLSFWAARSLGVRSSLKSAFLSEETIYRSRLKMIAPQSRPNRSDKGRELNTVYRAYPPENEARTAVERIVAPIPKYLFRSIAHSSLPSIVRSAPEHPSRNLFIEKVIGLLPRAAVGAWVTVGPQGSDLVWGWGSESYSA